MGLRPIKLDLNQKDIDYIDALANYRGIFGPVAVSLSPNSIDTGHEFGGNGALKPLNNSISAMSALNQILKKLGIEKSKSLFKSDDLRWQEEVPFRLQKGIEEIRPDLLYVQERKPLILFFASGEVNEKEISKKIWNLGGVPIVIFVKSGVVSICNGFLFDPKESLFAKLRTKNKELNVEDLSLWNVMSGNLWQELSKIKGANKVDKHLLENIQDAQRELIKENLDSTTASNLIGRLLFSRYLLDRGVVIDRQHFHDSSSFIDLIANKDALYKYFRYLKINFNGDLFPLAKGEKELITDKHLDLLSRLFRGDKMSSGQMSLFNYYDFKIIPIELISEVYERFIGEDNQRTEGAYYTPTFLVDYILAKTVREKLKKQNHCKVLDPSCGSGIFLVESLRCIIEKKKTTEGKLLKPHLKQAVKENIFGVDKDENAVNLTIFSLYLTLLDYQEPKDISKFKFPNLKNTNIFAADYFDLSNSFNKTLKGLEFDFILGNPPWKSDPKGNLQIEYYKKDNIPVSDYQIAQTFAARARDFSSTTTQCALILTSKIFYNHEAEDFRKYLLDKFYIDEILEMSPVRKHLFAQATAPSAILFYRYAHEQDTSQNTVIHTSIKPNIFLKYLGLIVIEKNDRKEIQQDYFLKYDWIWKAMLYGNVFDFHFLSKLKELSQISVNTLISENRIVFSAGFISGAKDQKTMNELSSMVFVQTSEIELYKQKCKFSKIADTFPNLKFKDKGVLAAYNAPHLLLKRSLRDKPVFTYLEKKCAFPNTIFGIHSNDTKLLKALGAYFSSKFIRYYLFLTSTTWGIEREEVLQKEYKMLPFPFDEKTIEKLSALFDKIMLIAVNKYNDNSILKNNDWDEQIETIIQNIDEFLMGKLRISTNDKGLIHYATDISIPLFYADDHTHKNISEPQLKQYAKVFIDYFGKKWDGKKGKFFEVDIFKNNFIVGINFKVTESKTHSGISFQDNEDVLSALSHALNIGAERISDRFFRQRDIRGFQKNSFYIIKPNEYKNWHPAIAQIDLHEFLNDLLYAEFKSSDKQ